MHEEWDDIKDHLSRILDNEARTVSDAEIAQLEYLVQWDDKKLAAVGIQEVLKNSALEGELLQIYANRISQLIGEKIDIRAATRTQIYERSAWVTNPQAKTFEIGW